MLPDDLVFQIAKLDRKGKLLLIQLLINDVVNHMDDVVETPSSKAWQSQVSSFDFPDPTWSKATDDLLDAFEDEADDPRK